MTCDAGEVVVVPFPFTDRTGTKRRPALVLSARSFNDRNGHTLMAMITTAKATAWTLDTPFDWGAVGLSQPCVIRMKLSTVDNRLIVRPLGMLGRADWAAVQQMFEPSAPNAS